MKKDIFKKFFNEDCIRGANEHIPDNSIDLIITDPPYGINGGSLHKHYNRDEEFVIDGYVEVHKSEYAEFSKRWIEQAERILKPGGGIYIVSGYTNLVHILNALSNTNLQEINHIIWKYNFGVYTQRKFVSSHYHILYYVKPGEPYTFNTFCKYGADEKNKETGRSENYKDREDVWLINRKFKPGEKKNKNELPEELLIKLIQYSSNEGDVICDLFLGGFSTAKVALGMNRSIIGFEVSKNIFDHGEESIKQIDQGEVLRRTKIAKKSKPLPNQGKSWVPEEKQKVLKRYDDLVVTHRYKNKAIEILSGEFGRGSFSLLNVINAVHKTKKKST